MTSASSRLRLATTTPTDGASAEVLGIAVYTVRLPGSIAAALRLDLGTGGTETIASSVVFPRDTMSIIASPAARTRANSDARLPLIIEVVTRDLEQEYE